MINEYKFRGRLNKCFNSDKIYIDESRGSWSKKFDNVIKNCLISNGVVQKSNFDLSYLHENVSDNFMKTDTAGDGISNAKSISIANVDSSNDAKVDLFLNRKEENFYILKDVDIPNKNTLILGPEDNIAFNNSSTGFSLRIQVDNGSGAAAEVDVIIKR